MSELIAGNAYVLAMVAMLFFMLWYWAIAYKYDAYSWHIIPSLLFIAAVPTFFICCTVGFALSAGLYPAIIAPSFAEIEHVRYLPFGAAFLVVTTLGVVASSVLADGVKVSEEKHKLWYVAIAYQVIMITHVLTGW